MRLKSIYIFTIGLFFAACSANEDLIPSRPDSNKENENITVQLNLQTPTFNVEETRASAPLDPENENPMYNIWVLHFNHEQLLIPEDTKYISFGTMGTLSDIGRQIDLTLNSSNPNGTICIVANLEAKTTENKPSSPNNNNRKWANTLPLFKKELLALPIETQSSSTVGLPNAMYMYGYYQGNLASSQAINITLGRMVARLDIKIDMASGEESFSNIKMQLKNAPIQIHYSPMEINDSETSIYKDFPIENLGALSSTSSAISRYYYIGENINPEPGKETVLEIKATPSGKSEKTYTIKLGANAPGTSNDYSLYRNNNYTFNINLKGQ